MTDPPLLPDELAEVRPALLQLVLHDSAGYGGRIDASNFREQCGRGRER